MNCGKWIIGVLTLLAALTLLATGAHAEGAKIKVLIIDGQNNHKWAETTPYLKAILEEAGVFTVSVSTTPPAKPSAAQKANSDALWAKWRPRFSDYDVIVSNYNGEQWPEEVRASFLAFVKNGGGLVSYHAADNAFADWADYNEMIALGGWGGRNEKSGPYLRLRDGAWTQVQEPGPCGGHGAQHEFLIETFASEHPIMKGLPSKWMHTKDELYHQLRGPAKELKVLGSALSDITHEREPMLMAITFGQGRIFHTTLGHYLEALQGLGFQVTFARGTEWAATGRVTQPAPKPGELTEGPTAAMHALKIKPPTP
jgi:uncharacterized protein